MSKSDNIFGQELAVIEDVILNRRELMKSWLSRTLIEAGANGVKVDDIADVMGKSPSLLYKAANTGEADHNLQAHDLIPVLYRSGDFFILRELARLFEFALIPTNNAVDMVTALLDALRGAKEDR